MNEEELSAVNDTPTQLGVEPQNYLNKYLQLKRMYSRHVHTERMHELTRQMRHKIPASSDRAASRAKPFVSYEWNRMKLTIWESQWNSQLLLNNLIVIKENNNTVMLTVK